MGTKKETTDQVTKSIIIEGIVKSAYIGTSKFSDTRKNRLALQSDAIPYDEITAFVNAGTKLTPAWFKDKNGYMNLASIYNIPVKDIKGREITFEDFCELETAIGSKIRIALTQKDGAIYPRAFIVLEEGEARDAFEGL